MMIVVNLKATTVMFMEADELLRMVILMITMVKLMLTIVIFRKWIHVTLCGQIKLCSHLLIVKPSAEVLV